MSAGSNQTSGQGNGNAFDLGAIRNILEQDKIDCLKGVRNTDVDWLLRDSNIERNSPPKYSSNNTLNEPNPRSPGSPVSPHLQTNISNTNEHNLSKTKPSMAPIQEEIAATSRTHEGSRGSDGSQKRRVSMSGMGSLGSGLHGLFFSKLKGKLSHKPQDENAAGLQAPLFKENYNMGSKSNSNLSSKPSSSPGAYNPRTKGDKFADNRLLRTMSTPSCSKRSLDPRLDEYIKFYLQKDKRRSSAASTVSSVSLSEGSSNPPVYPSKQPLPSALVNCFDHSKYTGDNSLQPEATSTSNKISSFLRRRSSTNPPLPTVSMATEKNRRNSESTNSVASTPINTPSPSRQSDGLPEFSGLKPLKRVAFHSLTFLIDPPQQIPSRNPRKGNVEILINGTLQINPLSEEDKLAIEKSQMGQGGGIVVGGSGSIASRELLEVQHHDESKHVETPLPSDNLGKDDEETKVDKHAKLLGIDKPMVSHHNINSIDQDFNSPIKKMALDVMYTRCCHLREILPIPAILKQIPEGSMAPLSILQLKNPTPTMVEIQTFADFIRIAPILCISLDGVNLSLDQFTILLSAMSAKKQLEKLSLRNTPIDHEGWSLLCWFLSRNKMLNKLDITQCPSLSVNIIKKKKKKSTLDDKSKSEEEIKRMICNKENRSDMDWSLFTASIIARGGIEELILTGCCITDLDVFEKFVKLAIKIKTNRLGLAYNNLSVKQLRIIVDNWLFDPAVRGLDLGYNDFLSLQFLNIFLQKRKDKEFENSISKCSMVFLSLNATNLRFSDAFKEVFETIIMRFPSLKYLDFSNNPKLFGSFSPSPTKENLNSELLNNPPGHSSPNNSLPENSTQSSIITYFTSTLPLFPKLIRLHLENDNLSTSALVSIAKVLPFCKNLAYFSILGNNVDLTAGSAMIQALKNSKTLITLDCDYDNFPDLFKERIGLYSMKNMERLLYASKKTHDMSPETNVTSNNTESTDNIYSLTEQLNNILSKKVEDKLDLSSREVQQFIAKATTIRQELKDAMNELLKLQVKNELTLDGKETFIRFLFIESSIEKGLLLIDNSLVDDELKKQNYNFILHNSAEDVNASRQILNNQDIIENRQLDIPTSPNIPSSKSPLSLSRSSSKSNLTQLDRQEGSILKLLKLHDYHHANKNQEESDFFHNFDDLSGDEIREKLSNIDLGDLDKIIQYLAGLKEKGISIGKAFNMNEQNVSSERMEANREALLVDEIKIKLNNLKGIKNPVTNSEENDSNDLQGEFEDASTEFSTDSHIGSESNSEKIDGISQAYDQVLNEFAKLD